MRRSRLRVASLSAIAVLALAGCGSTVALNGSDAALGGTNAAGGLDGTGTGAGTATSSTAASGATDVPGSTATGAPATSVGSGVPTDSTTSSPDIGAGSSSSLTGPKTPLSLGFLETATGNASSLGLNAGTTITDDQIYRAVIAYYNAHGGIGGRKINPVYAYTDTGGSDWQSEFQAACAKFTQDNHVSAVLGYEFAYFDTFEQCLQNKNVVHVLGSYEPGDIVAQQSIPTLVSSASPSVDVIMRAMFEGGINAGLITTKNRLGIFLDTCAHSDRAWKNSGKPYLDAQKIPYDYQQTPCDNGAGDAGGSAADISSAVLRFKSAGAKTVVATGVALVVFMAAANSQNYHPQYVTTLGGAAIEPNGQRSQMVNTHGFSWLPALDVDPQQYPSGYNGAQLQCLKMLNASGLKPKEYNDFALSWITCDAIGLYARAAALAPGATGTAFAANIVKALPGFQTAATYNGKLQATSHARGGPAYYRQYAWSNKCSCFTYTGPVYPIPVL